MDFDTAVELLLSPKVEGAYSFNRNDPGGETMWGVTKKTAIAHGYKGDMRYLSKATAVQIYHDEYWTPQLIDEMPDIIRYCLFDTCVNEGVEKAAEFLHEILGMEEGPIDEPTTVAAGLFDSTSLAAALMGKRITHYTSLPTWGMFGRGWMNRMVVNLQIIANIKEPTV